MAKKILIVAITFVVLVVTIFSGCSTTRALRSARDRIVELEQINEEGTKRNTELENLLESERIGNQQMGELLSRIRSENERYLESERNRIEAEKQLANSLSGIFREGSDIIEQLIRGYHEIRKYLENKGLLAETIYLDFDCADTNSGDGNYFID
jgi:peptidoglycan hydrolase CwlO-like protein